MKEILYKKQEEQRQEEKDGQLSLFQLGFETGQCR